jgi:tRNA1(Val) A37 N6-methylase TrmN6
MMNLTQDYAFGRRLLLNQPAPPDSFRFTSDALFLAAFFSPPSIHMRKKKLLDVGCGTGIIALYTALRYPNLDVVGLEQEHALWALAKDNAQINQLNVDFILGSIFDSTSIIDKYDYILTNPPYFCAKGTPSPFALRHRARQHQHSILDWLNGCSKLLKDKGYLGLIYPASSLGDVLYALHQANCFCAKLLPLFPKANKPAKRMLIWAKKNAQPQLEWLPGLVLHEESGQYTSRTQQILYGEAVF